MICASRLRRPHDIVRNGSYFVAIESDETNDPRPKNNYCVTLDISLLPKVSTVEEKCDVETYHVKFEFPEAVNHESMSSLIDQVGKHFFPFHEPPPQGLRQLYIQPCDVIFFFLP